MCQSGNGFKNTGQRDCQPREKMFMGMLLIKPRLGLAPNAYGFGLQLSQNTGIFFGLVCQLKRAMLVVAERFIASLINRHGKHPVSTDGGTWYPQACGFLKLKHHIHSPCGKSFIERTMQCIKDRTGGFDDYFPCRKKKCKLKHVKRRLNLFAYHHNSEIIS
jgi:hypothetical protein